MCVCIYSRVPFTYLEVKEKLQKINMNETQCRIRCHVDYHSKISTLRIVLVHAFLWV